MAESKVPEDKLALVPVLGEDDKKGEDDLMSHLRQDLLTPRTNQSTDNPSTQSNRLTTSDGRDSQLTTTGRSDLLTPRTNKSAGINIPSGQSDRLTSIEGQDIPLPTTGRSDPHTLPDNTTDALPNLDDIVNGGDDMSDMPDPPILPGLSRENTSTFSLLIYSYCFWPVCWEEQDKSSDIEQQPSFGDRK